MGLEADCDVRFGKQSSSGHARLEEKELLFHGDFRRAQERARESLQLDIYALAHLKSAGRLPDWVELRFLESGLAGGKRPTLEEAARTETRIRDIAALIRRRDFTPRPSFMACGLCAFREICPHTARGPETEREY